MTLVQLQYKNKERKATMEKDTIINEQQIIGTNNESMCWMTMRNETS
jgi:hypothetical protein